MSSTNCDFVLLSALDDIAWITNIRGSDIHCASCFFSYLLITQDQAFLYSQQPSSDPVFEEFKDNLTVLPYDSAVSDIPSKIGDKKAWTEVSLNHAIASQISNKIETSVSHVCMMKCCKNETEKKSMYSANLKAARAISKYLAWLQNGNWKHHDEVSASDKLYDLYAAENDFMSLSFDTISSTGPSGAILHYKAKRESCKKIIENTTYLVDSGCQYLDGTTDTTRTVWIGDGEVNDYIKECYTRVLKGHIQIASVKFPEGTRGYQIDSLARKALWDAGLDFLQCVLTKFSFRFRNLIFFFACIGAGATVLAKIGAQTHCTRHGPWRRPVRKRSRKSKKHGHQFQVRLYDSAQRRRQTSGTRFHDLVETRVHCEQRTWILPGRRRWLRNSPRKCYHGER